MDIPLTGSLFSLDSALTLILCVLAIEAFGLLIWSARDRSAPRFANLVGNLVSGAFLVSALKLAVNSAPPAAILLCLTGSLFGHLFDLSRQVGRKS
ncbi:MAG: hypothetical protein AAGA88_11910 [Pseudomonadota bacterium]